MIHNCPELMETIERMGFLPLLDSCVDGFSADAMITPDESHQLLMEHFRSILPQASAKQLDKLIG